MKKRITLLFIGALMIPMALLAQDDVKRPNNMGNSDFDNFKNSAFDIKDESQTLKESVTQIDNEVKNYSGVINTIGVDKLKNNLKALKESKEAVKTLNDRVGVLDEQGKSMLDNAKTVKPKMKSISATKNTNQSIKGLNLAKSNLKSVGEILDEDIKLITDELKARGEPIE